jgi:hypothetical protein
MFCIGKIVWFLNAVFLGLIVEEGNRLEAMLRGKMDLLLRSVDAVEVTWRFDTKLLR